MDFSNISFYAITGLVNFVTSFSFGTFIYFKDKKNPVNIGFALFAWSLAFWMFFYFFWQVTTERNIAYILIKTLMSPVIFIFPSALYFSIALLGEYRKRRREILWTYALYSIFFLLLIFTRLIIRDIEPALSFNFWPKAGLALPFFMLAMWASFFRITYLLIRGYKGSDVIRKGQIRYALMGIVIAYLTGSFNWFLWYDIPIPPILNLGISFYTVLIGYAALRYRLFRLNVVIVELLAFIFWAVLLFRVFSTRQSLDLFLADFFLMVSLGGFLIWSSFQQARQNNLLEKLNTDLDDLNQNLENKVAEQTKEVRKAYEVEKRAREGLEQLNETKNSFILAAQHNLRTPLTVARGYNQEALSRIDSSDTGALKTSLEKSGVALDEMVQLVNELLAVTEMKVSDPLSKK